MASEYAFLPAPKDASSLSPREARELFRINQYYGTTSGFCLGHVHANLAVVPASCADQFEEFCRRNSAALPLLYRSLPGEKTAPPLAANSDVRTDLPRYVIFSHGRQVHDMLDLSGFNWEENVSFYFGCSFSFERALLNSGVSLSHVKDNILVNMYKANINCYNSCEQLTGVKMIVTMRPIKKENLSRTVSVTSCYPVCGHGAPIHIGDPSKIGISDINGTDIMGEVAEVTREEVPVFWACGVTAKCAMVTLGADLSFTHYPGSMFVTDLTTDSFKVVPATEEDVPLVVPVSTPRMAYWASLATGKVLKHLRALEDIILHDPGCCGIQKLKEEGDFTRAVFSLSHARSVAVIFGFPCNAGCENLEETDGPPGAFAIAQALQALGKKVVIVSENRNKILVEKCSEYLVNSGALKSKVDFVSCSDLSEGRFKDYDCLVAIERIGQAKDGCHYSSIGTDLTPLLEPIDELFGKAQSNPSIVTIGIGDRGNELGLGKVKERVANVMRDGAKLGCIVTSDHVILAGVSNWGGYALSVGLYILVQCPVHWRYVSRGVNVEEDMKWMLDQFLPTDEQTKGLLTLLNQLGVSDGINHSYNQSVDGLPLQVHLDQLREMRNVAM